jgi:lysophospholipase L1-like esterase
MVHLLGRTGARVVLLTIPCAGGRVPTGQASQFLAGAFDINRVNAANAVIRQVAAQSQGRAHVLDLFSVVCPNGKFAAVINGVVMRTDGVHFSEGGARLVAGWLLPQLAALSRSPQTPADATASSRP